MKLISYAFTIILLYAYGSCVNASSKSVCNKVAHSILKFCKEVCDQKVLEYMGKHAFFKGPSSKS